MANKFGRFDRVYCLDLEATCQEPKEPGMMNQIIEIGIVPIDLRGGIKVRFDQAFGSLVKPTRVPISAFCTELTGITQEMVDQAEPIQKVFARIKEEFKDIKYCPLIAYGNYDRDMLQDSCREHAMEWIFSKTYHNFKSLYPILMGKRKEIGQAKALEEMKIDPVGMQHRAKDDAANLAQLVSEVLIRIPVN